MPYYKRKILIFFLIIISIIFLLIAFTVLSNFNSHNKEINLSPSLEKKEEIINNYYQKENDHQKEIFEEKSSNKIIIFSITIILFIIVIGFFLVIFYRNNLIKKNREKAELLVEKFIKLRIEALKPGGFDFLIIKKNENGFFDFEFDKSKKLERELTKEEIIRVINEGILADLGIKIDKEYAELFFITFLGLIRDPLLDAINVDNNTDFEKIFEEGKLSQISQKEKEEIKNFLKELSENFCEKNEETKNIIKECKNVDNYLNAYKRRTDFFSRFLTNFKVDKKKNLIFDEKEFSRCLKDFGENINVFGLFLFKDENDKKIFFNTTVLEFVIMLLIEGIFTRYQKAKTDLIKCFFKILLWKISNVLYLINFNNKQISLKK